MWVLIEEAQSKVRDKEIYFKQMTGIGPATTDDVREAETFSSKEAALMSPACRFSLTFFEPIEVDVRVKNKAAA